jgi:hypothetical protein
MYRILMVLVVLGALAFMAAPAMADHCARGPQRYSGHHHHGHPSYSRYIAVPQYYGYRGGYSPYTGFGGCNRGTAYPYRYGYGGYGGYGSGVNFGIYGRNLGVQFGYGY